MTPLLDKLRSATEGSRDLSDEVLFAAGWTHDGQYWLDANGTNRTLFDDMPSPTESIDAALTLVPEGWNKSFCEMPGHGRVTFSKMIMGGHLWAQEQANTLPIAICLGALLARDKETEYSAALEARNESKAERV